MTNEIKIQGANEIKSGSKKEEFFIFIDFDGVLSDWLTAACEVNDLDINDPKLYKELKKGAFLDKLDWLDGKKIWSNITKEGTKFWKNLKLLPWAKRLVEEMEKLGNVYFLTSPGTCAPAATGKLEWVEDNFNKYIEKVIICKDKHVCASSNSILIDDSEFKIRDFSKHGGHVFEWPNQFKIIDKDTDLEETIENLRKEIRKAKK